MNVLKKFCIACALCVVPLSTMQAMEKKPHRDEDEKKNKKKNTVSGWFNFSKYFKRTYKTKNLFKEIDRIVKVRDKNNSYSLDALKKILDSCKVDINTTEYSNGECRFYKPLHLACKQKLFDVAGLLVDKGALINAAINDKDPRTAVSCACENFLEFPESGKILRFLLVKGGIVSYDALYGIIKTGMPCYFHKAFSVDQLNKRFADGIVTLHNACTKSKWKTIVNACKKNGFQLYTFFKNLSEKEPIRIALEHGIQFSSLPFSRGNAELFMPCFNGLKKFFEDLLLGKQLKTEIEHFLYDKKPRCVPGDTKKFLLDITDRQALVRTVIKNYFYSDEEKALTLLSKMFTDSKELIKFLDTVVCDSAIKMAYKNWLKNLLGKSISNTDKLCDCRFKFKARI